MTGLCVSGNLVSAGDVSIKVTEHCPHLLWKRRRRHIRLEPNPFPTKRVLITCTASLSWCTFGFDICLLFWRALYSIYPPSSLVEMSWWTEGARLTADRLASAVLPPPPTPPQSFFLWWVMHPLQATMVAVSGGENQIWANYHNGLLYSGRRLINSPPGLHTKNDWSVQLSVFRCDF